MFSRFISDKSDKSASLFWSNLRYITNFFLALGERMPERAGEGLLGLPNPIRSPYESLIIHNAFVGKEEEDHSDDRRAESESWTE